MTLSRISLLSVCLSFSFAAAASATPIAVNNPSFENSPSTPSGCAGIGCAYGTTSPSGWSGGGSFIPGNPGNTLYFNYVPDGSVVAYSNAGNITQTVGATIIAGDTYTMSVYIGQRSDSGGVYSSFAGLMIGGILYTATGTTPTEGNWSLYTVNVLGTAGMAGDSIQIVLGQNSYQGDFDDVSLSYTAPSVTPEPSSISLMALGLVVIFYMVFRRRTQAAL